MAFWRLGYRLEKLPVLRPRFSMAEALRRAAERRTPVRTVIDVGASDGAWSRVALRHFPEAQYLLFEPLEERKEPLARFCARHPNARQCAAAAGAERGEISFHIASDLDGSGCRHGEGPDIAQFR